MTGCGKHDCKANVFHLLPDRAMRADAIGQYLAWKGWQKLGIAARRKR